MQASVGRVAGPAAAIRQPARKAFVGKVFFLDLNVANSQQWWREVGRGRVYVPASALR